ncbi:MAG: alpha/beta fold hydrolase [Planctomycetes bacterium]|nr:alpha/beta fold hydrolase [Planctomycetota bacterium]
MQRRTGRLRQFVLRSSALVALGWLASGAFTAWKLTDRPNPLRAERQPTWLRAEDVRLKTRDGEELGAWFDPGAPGKPVVLFFHGMGGSRSSLALSAQRVSMEGDGYLAVSLRSFGDSSGGALDFGWSSRADVLAAVEFVEAHKPGAPLIVVGQSLGAAAAIFAAPELGRRVSGYVLEGPYRDLEKACHDRLDRQLFAPFASLAFLGLRLWAPCFLPTALDAVRPIDQVGRFSAGVPVLFVAGAYDEQAPVEDVRFLTETCSADAELAVLDAHDHRDLWALDERHWELWSGFLARVEHAGNAGVPY